MTRQEAILQLQAARLMLLGNDNQPVSDLYYAIDVAITALEQVPTYRKKAKRWKRKYLALKTEIEKMKAEILENYEKITGVYDESTPEDERPIQKISRNVARGECLEIINKHIGKENADAISD